MRRAGILMPISSLPSRYGIGCFSKEAYEFIDGLAKAKQTYWQVLPLGPTSYGDSPYQSFSTFAGNPYFIDLEELISQGLITKEECDECDFGNDNVYIDYKKIYDSRFGILWIAFENFDTNDSKYKKFKKDNKDWLDEYALYMAIKDSYNGEPWVKWDEDIKNRNKKAIKEYSEELKDDIEFYKFIQFEFYSQWMKLKKYANDKGVLIIGDIPIYVSFDSADCWGDRQLFQFNEENEPVAVAGCPPDAFSEDGQLWGNPLYDWGYHKKTEFEWWIRRVKQSFTLYDIVRIDHFRGFDEYFSIPYGDETAAGGHWEKGPGIALFNKIKEELGEVKIIAEDLGFLTDTVIQLVKDTGFPGMKLIQFAFDSREPSNYLPYTYDRNTVVYTGTHDNDTIKGWYEVLSYNDKKHAKNYLNNQGINKKNASTMFIKVALASVSDTAIIPIQDYLNLGSEARINIPSTIGENWKWRILKSQMNDELWNEIKELTELYDRNPKN